MDPPCSCPTQPHSWFGATESGAFHATHYQSLEAVATIGIDTGKNTFHLVGLDRNGAIVLRQKLSRRQVEARLTCRPASSAWSRALGRIT
jgi:hypothetical protein